MMGEREQQAAAYVDGELQGEARAAFERTMAGDGDLAREVAAQRALRDRITRRFAPIADEPVPEGLRALLGQPTTSNVVDFGAAKARRRLPGWGGMTAIAASLIAGVIAGQMVDLSGRPIGSEGGTLIAQGGLGRALDVQLASAQPADASTRIGVTFRESGGALCRSFDSAQLAGIACRSGGRWQLRNLIVPAHAEAGGGYRQAGSGNAGLMQAAQTMMRGEPLDADAERRARDAGWR